jgi:hypothetical protein
MITDSNPMTISGQNFIGGLNRVFHCNYYNAFLQMTVLLSDGMTECAPKQLLKAAATPLVNYLKQQGYSEADLIREFSTCGFGKLRQIDSVTWETPDSHYSEASCFQEKPRHNCFFTAGYLQGITQRRVEEVACQMLGNSVDIFQVFEPQISDNYLLYDPPFTQIPGRFALEAAQNFVTTVDEDKIIAAVKKMPFSGKADPNDNGLIDIFGVLLTNHFADYLNRISYETYFCMRQAGVPEAEAKALFIQAGIYCAFFTYGGIMESEEWYNMVVPMCQTREDWLHGMIAIVNTLGWGIWRIEKLEPPQQLIIRVYNSYEGIGYRRMYPPTTDRNVSFLAMGGCIGLVQLLWKIDIREKPPLTWDFYLANFNNDDNNYRVTQTHAIAANDEYDRFVVTQ